MYMASYEDNNDRNSDAVFNDDRYLVIHWSYREALEKLNELIHHYDWMRSYLDRVKVEEENKVFIYDGDADEIKEMIDEIESRQKEIYKLLLR